MIVKSKFSQYLYAISRCFSTKQISATGHCRASMWNCWYRAGGCCGPADMMNLKKKEMSLFHHEILNAVISTMYE